MALTRPADALLVVEIADSSLPRDRQVKLPLYARAGVPEVWIVDVASEAIEVFSDPAGDEYATLRRHEATDGPLGCRGLPDVLIPIDTLFR